MLFKDSEIENLQACKTLALALNNIYEYLDSGILINLDQVELNNSAKEIMHKLFSLVINLDIIYELNTNLSTDFVNRFENEVNNIKNIDSLKLNINYVIFKLMIKIKNFCFDLIDLEGLSSVFKEECEELINDLDILFEKIYYDDGGESNFKSPARKIMDEQRRITKIRVDNSLSVSNEELKNIVDQMNKESSDYLEQLYDSTSKKTADILAKLQQEISDLQASTKQNVTDQIDGLKIELLKSKNELVGLVGDLESYKRLINHKSEEEVSKHYAKKAFWEMLTYWGATILSIVIIVVSICLAWSGLDGYFKTYVQETDAVKLKALAQTAEYAKIYLGFRLVLSFLLFSTVIYTSRIAYRAYIHWRHSESMKLKLSSLRPFINQLEPDDRKQIHKDLVPDYFGKDAGMIDVAGEKFKDFPTNVSAVVMKAMDHANGALGNSKKDEPAKDDKSTEEEKKETKVVG